MPQTGQTGGPPAQPFVLTSLSSLATSFRSPRTNSKSSTMILICSFTLALEAAGGPSDGDEEEDAVPLDWADILRGSPARPAGHAGQASAAAAGRLAPSLRLPELPLQPPPPPPARPRIPRRGRRAAPRSAGRPRCAAAIGSRSGAGARLQSPPCAAPAPRPARARPAPARPGTAPAPGGSGGRGRSAHRPRSEWRRRQGGFFGRDALSLSSSAPAGPWGRERCALSPVSQRVLGAVSPRGPSPLSSGAGRVPLGLTGRRSKPAQTAPKRKRFSWLSH